LAALASSSLRRSSCFCSAVIVVGIFVSNIR
jgi:hypothetical protein